MEDTHTIRISESDYQKIILAADGRSVAEEVHRMLTGVTNVTGGSVTNVTEFEELKEEIKALLSRMDKFMTHGQGGIRVYPMPVDRVDGKCVPRVVELEQKGISRSTDYPPNAQASFKNEFRTAKQVKEEG